MMLMWIGVFVILGCLVYLYFSHFRNKEVNKTTDDNHYETLKENNENVIGNNLKMYFNTFLISDVESNIVSIPKRELAFRMFKKYTLRFQRQVKTDGKYKNFVPEIVHYKNNTNKNSVKIETKIVYNHNQSYDIKPDEFALSTEAKEFFTKFCLAILITSCYCDKKLLLCDGNHEKVTDTDRKKRLTSFISESRNNLIKTLNEEIPPYLFENLSYKKSKIDKWDTILSKVDKGCDVTQWFTNYGLDINVGSLVRELNLDTIYYAKDKCYGRHIAIEGKDGALIETNLVTTLCTKYMGEGGFKVSVGLSVLDDHGMIANTWTMNIGFETNMKVEYIS